MGYMTDFWGGFDCEPSLSKDQVAYLQAFNETRRMARDEAKASKLPDPLREAVGLPIGFEGSYFVGASTDGNYGQGDDGSVIERNAPAGSRGFGVRINADSLDPRSQPGLWCQWRPSDDGSVIVWDEGEKFYNYVEWLQYIVKHFLEPWGIALSGTINWEGEESGDLGQIKVEGSKVLVSHGEVTFTSFQEVS